ncbi:hypothetical protein [Acanthopleuribacter pedis]|uniref:CHASE2 domain-containing protein n=1 Tax=Acanthopleuribacter pedis TaxID=442870 RepID=A0A8J7QEH7_9BACT|nr:hypothetical protein [Acanthopleuribacter pedis]MBO1317513.1 hypothetical protein [Acanthopleuribacter pedis]
MNQLPTMLYLLNPGLDRHQGVVSLKPLLAGLLVFALLVISGWGTAVNQKLRQYAALFTPAPTQASAQVMLLGDRQTTDTPDWSLLMNRILEAEPRGVVFLFRPDAEPAFFQQAAQSGKVAFTEPLSPLDAGRDREQAAQVYRDLTGVTLPPWFSLAPATAPAAVPAATYRHLLAGRVPRETLRSSWVVVSPPDARYRPAARRLLPDGTAHDADVLFAAGLGALLNGNWITLPSPLQRLALVLAGMILIAAAGQFLYIRAFLKVTLLFANSALFLSWACLTAFDLWLPLGDMLLCLAVLLAVCLLQRYFLMIERVRLFQLDFAAMVQRCLPREALHHRDPWQWAAGWLGLALPRARGLLLELRNGRLVQRALLGDGAVPVTTQNQNPELPPYSHALRNLAPQRVDHFMADGEGEAQWLIPLTTGRRRLGFLLIGLPAAREADAEQSDAARLAAVADTLAGWLDQQIDENGAWSRLKRLLGFHVDAACMIPMRAHTALLELFLVHGREGAASTPAKLPAPRRVQAGM